MNQPGVLDHVAWPMRFVAVLLACLTLVPLPVAADAERPIDERATSRLIVAEMQRQAPQAQASVSHSSDRPMVVVMSAGVGTSLWAADIHQKLRGAADGAARAAILQAFVTDALVKVAKRAHTPEPSFDLTQIMPVLRTQEQIEFISGGSATYRVTAFGGLIQCWVIYVPKQPRGCLQTSQARQLGFGKLEITALGLNNLEAQQGDMVETFDGRVRHVTLGARFAASLMLSTNYWQGQGTGKVIAAIPTDDDLFWVEDPSDAELSQLRTRVGELHGRATRREIPPREEIDLTAYGLSLGVHPLSTDLFLRTGSGWEILPE
jgi:hypothetical protein